ncbi:hypothetical protein ACIA8O_11730 [Kitasatospora sp. NPDC051853]|uniref:hypothetical protein n=1 Tax=Kitasatospora sp. NPDC051853 TaxID=3364058 RepID=UPI0037A2DD76
MHVPPPEWADGTSTRSGAAGTCNNPGTYALLQEDGNFVLYKAEGSPGEGGALWSAYTWDKI